VVAQVAAQDQVAAPVAVAAVAVAAAAGAAVEVQEGRPAAGVQEAEHHAVPPRAARTKPAE
jgi:hypothetical protein